MYKNIAILLLTAVLLGGCGLTGDLYLPEDDAAAESVSAVPGDEEDGEAEGDEE